MKSLSATAVLVSLLVFHGFGESVAKQSTERPNGSSRSIGGGFGSFGNAGNEINQQSWMWTSGFNGGGGLGSGSGGGHGEGGSFGGTSGFGSESNYFASGGPNGFWSTWPSPAYSWRWISGPSRGNQRTSGQLGQMGSSPTLMYYTWGNPSGQGMPGGLWGMQRQGSSGGQWGEQMGSGDQSKWFSEGNFRGQVGRQNSRGGGRLTGLIGRQSGMGDQKELGLQLIGGNGGHGGWKETENRGREILRSQESGSERIFTGQIVGGSEMRGGEGFGRQLSRSNSDQGKFNEGGNFGRELSEPGPRGQGAYSGQVGEQGREGGTRISQQHTGGSVDQTGQVDREGSGVGQSEIGGFGGRQTEQWGQGREIEGFGYGITGPELEGDGHASNLGRLTVPFGSSRVRGRQFGNQPDIIYKMSFTGFGREQGRGQSDMGRFSGLGGSGEHPVAISSTGVGGWGGLSGTGGPIFFTRRGKLVTKKSLKRLYNKYQKRGQGQSFIQFLQQSGILVRGFGAPRHGGSGTWYWTSGPQYWTWGPQTSSRRQQSWFGGSRSGRFGSGFGESSDLTMGESSGSGLDGNLGLGTGSDGTWSGSFGTDSSGFWRNAEFGSGSSNFGASSDDRISGSSTVGFGGVLGSGSDGSSTGSFSTDSSVTSGGVGVGSASQHQVNQ